MAGSCPKADVTQGWALDPLLARRRRAPHRCAMSTVRENSGPGALAATTTGIDPLPTFVAPSWPVFRTYSESAIALTVVNISTSSGSRVIDCSFINLAPRSPRSLFKYLMGSPAPCSIMTLLKSSRRSCPDLLESKSAAVDAHSEAFHLVVPAHVPTAGVGEAIDGFFRQSHRRCLSSDL